MIAISFLWFEENRGPHYLNFLLCSKHFNKQLAQTFFPQLDGPHFSVHKGTWHHRIQPGLVSVGVDCTLYEIFFLQNMLCVNIITYDVVFVSLKMCCHRRWGPWLSVPGGILLRTPAPNPHTWLISVHFKYKRDRSSEVLLWALGVSHLWQGWFSSMPLRRWTPARAEKSPQTSHQRGGRSQELLTPLQHSLRQD